MTTETKPCPTCGCDGTIEGKFRRADHAPNSDVEQLKITAECDYDPCGLLGQAIGMFHCPKCGDMVLAGLPHPPPDTDADGDLCISLYCGHRREYHVPKCAFSACGCEKFEDAPTAEEADAYLRGLGVIKKCDVCGQDATLTNDFVTHLMKRYAAHSDVEQQLREALVRAVKEGRHGPMCDRSRCVCWKSAARAVLGEKVK